ncbi:MAG: ketoacyl-ACP synthase III [Salinivirgaceae bacterium]|nr:ketoacyl-ACP synthase III [Salinivirgaceae bacterium]MDD4746076.1 ketoacyl-ACP synthase III [Salinivirgaceae bacterium]MDY0280271.1 ketoacyl-ACP synthase III [Salinivirgaceae bacterium]
MKFLNTIITGTGCYIPEKIVKNSDFLKQVFFEKDKTALTDSQEMIVNKLKDITGISERRWASKDQTASSLATLAAKEAIKDAKIDPETIDQIIVAQNFGDIDIYTNQTDLLPSIASRVKHNLGIQNPSCIPYDIIFGCPGWLQALIQADAYIKAGLAKRCLVIGAEALSRVIDIFDRDSMIFSDGAGAAIVEAVEGDEQRGILSTANMSHTNEEASYLFFGKTYAPNNDSNIRYMKMNGRKIYEYSLMHVPGAMKTALDKTNVPIEKISKILIHQANEKMDEAIVKRFFRLYGVRRDADEVMPMSIRELGNSSVATIPTLYDLILKGKIPNHSIAKDNYLIFASVGAGMNINAVVYKQ